MLTAIEGIARVHGAAPNKKTALLRDPLLKVIDRIDTATSAGLRDRAFLLLGLIFGDQVTETSIIGRPVPERARPVLRILYTGSFPVLCKPPELAPRCSEDRS